MKKKAGLWIDFKHAVIVINPDREEEIKQVASRINKRVSDASSTDVSKEDSEKALINERKRYYDNVISYLRNTNSVLIIGLGKAKNELKKRLAIYGFDDQTVVVKTAKKMIDKKIVADVHRHFD